MDSMARIESPATLESYRQRLIEEREGYKTVVSVCGGPGCHAQNCNEIYDVLKNAVEKNGLSGTVKIRKTGCHGFCEMGPLAVIQPAGILYRKITLEDVPAIVEKTLIKGEIIEDLLYSDPDNGKIIKKEAEVPFYAKQERLLMSSNQMIDPTSIEDYIAHGGYRALAKALHEMEPTEIIDEVEKAGLRGRGGAGFPAASTWK